MSEQRKWKIVRVTTDFGETWPADIGEEYDSEKEADDRAEYLTQCGDASYYRVEEV